MTIDDILKHIDQAHALSIQATHGTHCAICYLSADQAGKRAGRAISTSRLASLSRCAPSILPRLSRQCGRRWKAQSKSVTTIHTYGQPVQTTSADITADQLAHTAHIPMARTQSSRHRARSSNHDIARSL